MAGMGGEKIRGLAPVMVVAVGALTAFLGACGGDVGAPDRETAEVRDSAGIRVVDSPGPGWAEGAAWAVEPEPVRSVGALEGDDAVLLSRVRTPRLRDDGALILANAGTNQIRAFAPDGTLLWEAGGLGEGPGEYQGLSWIGLLPGDSVLVWDSRARRVSILDPEGVLARSYAAEPPEDVALAAPMGILDGDRLLISGGVSFSTTDAGQRDEVVWPETPLFVGDREGRIVAPVFTTRSREMRLVQTPQMVSVGEVPFGREGLAAAAGSRVVGGVTSRPELIWVDLQGDTVQVARWDHTPRAVDDALVETWMEAQLGDDDDPETRAYYRELIESVEIPERVPVFTDLVVDARGFVWLLQWRAPGASGHDRWWIVSPDGVLQGEVTLPEGFEVSQITDDVVVGVVRDELGVERVRLLPLVR